MPITIVTKGVDVDGPWRIEYAGTLIDEHHAIYVDTEFSLAVMECVNFDGTEYVTTYGEPAIFDLKVADHSFINSIRDMSAIELLQKLIPHKEAQ
ncbi:hypothetical protein [Paenibacillus sp. 1781tsa1]|uniref:hypothetical protein n=1 Tax=Paenibacillus sp. 1781tsa1 TaxID=2953810 RepID=UPI00209D5705|nr:hypothetical protein [Paenibacillus sp. 1781tsa1]MCP1186461.1 hypothetical protein [Paenibacillus sp. 1781tsa1]